ncbi:MAG: phytanoyl-CoA hydroxylase [Verrucomicrobiales bacterium]|jgi:phytanoyl-CoA hydroxylase
MGFAPQDFAKNGIAVFPDAISAQALESIRGRIDTLVDDLDPSTVSTVFSTDDLSHGRDDYFLTSGDKTRFFFEEGVFDDDGDLVVEKDRALNKIGHAMHDLDPAFSQFCRSAPFKDAARAAGMIDPVLLQSMVIFKHPEIGGEVPPHTDHTFLWTEPQSVIGLWVAIDEATQENGCMWALPKGHEVPVKSRFLRTADGSGTEMQILDDSPYPDDGWVPLEASPGTIIALHGSLPHRSAPNLSSKPRLAFTLHCVESTADYPANNWLQRPGFPFMGFDALSC